ncbi:hypothetical protein KPH14_012229 [Odynerus spinipes]|uniref:Gag-like protein n=1 Tax=Odynerus spinipes TaxID=1348599 RepID=A0AAD9REJ5_9HYME|nr:hypothetical protein KPH14_012229 [Odynerus spinipes]
MGSEITMEQWKEHFIKQLDEMEEKYKGEKRRMDRVEETEEKATDDEIDLQINRLKKKKANVPSATPSTSKCIIVDDKILNLDTSSVSKNITGVMEETSSDDSANASVPLSLARMPTSVTATHAASSPKSDEFQNVRSPKSKKSKRSSPASESPSDPRPTVLTANKFAVLSSFSEIKNFPQTRSVAPPVGPPSAPKSPQFAASTKKPRPPPIYISGFDQNIPAFQKRMNADFGQDAYQAKFLGKRIRIQFFYFDNHNNFKESLFQSKVPFYTFSTSQDRALVMILRGLPLIPIPELLDEIKSKGLTPISCSVINNKNSQSSFALYKINFPVATSIHEVTKIGFLLKTRIYWEKFLSKRLYTRCFKCQAFGHSAFNCNLPDKCVKCAGFHATSTCQKSPDTPPKCVICLGEHTANFSKCPILLSYLDKRYKRQNSNSALLNVVKPLSHTPASITRSATVPSSNVSSSVLSGRSYADILRPKVNPSRVEFSASTNINNDFGKFQNLNSALKELNLLCNMDLMLNAVNQLVSRLRKCNSNLEKLQAFMEVAATLD